MTAISNFLKDYTAAFRARKFSECDRLVTLLQQVLHEAIEPARGDLYEGMRLLKEVAPRFELDSLNFREQLSLFNSVDELAKEVLFPVDFITPTPEIVEYYKSSVEKGRGGFLSKFFLHRHVGYETVSWKPQDGEDPAKVTWLLNHLQKFIEQPTEEGYSALRALQGGLWNCPLYENFDKIESLIYLASVRGAESAWMKNQQGLSCKILTLFIAVPNPKRVEFAFDYVINQRGSFLKVQFEWQVCILNKLEWTPNRIEILKGHYNRLVEMYDTCLPVLKSQIEWEKNFIQTFVEKNEALSRTYA